MRNCNNCGLFAVESKSGPATCRPCSRLKYLAVKRRYQQSEKGKATVRQREDRQDVKEKRRQFGRSERGRANKAKYEQTSKGKIAARRKAVKYGHSEYGRRKAAERHLRTKDSPERITQRRNANYRYQQTEKYRAKRYREYAARKSAIVPSMPFTADDWKETVDRFQGRCCYCQQAKPLTLDHFIPVSKGGMHIKSNIVPACRSCNSRKKDKILSPSSIRSGVISF
jgi:5-methylcytosine-specific restriction endonuclease McrA